MHIESIAFSVTAPGASGANATAAEGDSLTIKYGRNPRILNVWADSQAAGWIQINYPTAHDTTRPFRAPVMAGEPTARMVMGLPMPITPQETMTITMAGSATTGDVESGCMLIAYDEMPGSNQNLMSWTDVVRQMEKLTTVFLTLTPAASSGGQWSGSEAINAETDLLIANRDYAVLGIEMQSECTAVSIKGPDTAGQRIAVPGSTEFADQSANWFALLSRAFGNMRTIPVINSANKNNTLIECVQDENLGTVTVAIMLALLK